MTDSTKIENEKPSKDPVRKSNDVFQLDDDKIEYEGMGSSTGRDLNTKLSELLDITDPIGTIGSPSSTNEISINILHNAVAKKLVGELGVFKYHQDFKTHYSLGQITEIELKNFLLEDPTIKSVARQKGLVNTISGIQDTHVGKMICSAIFGTNEHGFFEPSFLGTVPPTGTYLYVTNDQILNTILERQQRMLFYLGNVYGSKTKLPMWFKHFGNGVDGAGEAYHLGIFGSTGSGKSTLAKMILMAYSKYSQMGLFVIDPVGEFSKNIKSSTFRSDNITNVIVNNDSFEDGNLDEKFFNGFDLDIKKILYNLGKEFTVINVRNLILDRWDLFEEILSESYFFPRLSIKGEKKKEAATVIANYLQNKLRKNLTDLSLRETFDNVIDGLKDKDNIQPLIYATPEPRSRLNGILEQLSDTDRDQIFNRVWKPISELFQERPNATTVKSLLKRFAGEIKPLIIIDLSLQTAHNMKLDYWNETIQALIIKRLLQGLVEMGENAWQKDRSLNTLVVLDEAHRFARRERYENSDLENVRFTLLDSVKTTRKYGLGWMFLSTSLSSIHKDILQQLRIVFFGFGLSLGNDLITLRELISDNNALKLYQSFTDPANSFDNQSKKFSFMSKGPVSPISFSGTPLFLNVFNSADTFILHNHLLENRKLSKQLLTHTIPQDDGNNDKHLENTRISIIKESEYDF